MLLQSPVPECYRTVQNATPQEWPFFQSTIDLIEMILAKADMSIVELYDQVLVTDPQQVSVWNLAMSQRGA